MSCLSLPARRTRTSASPVQLTIAIVLLLVTTRPAVLARERLALPGCEAPDQFEEGS